MNPNIVSQIAGPARPKLYLPHCCMTPSPSMSRYPARPGSPLSGRELRRIVAEMIG